MSGFYRLYFFIALLCFLFNNFNLNAQSEEELKELKKAEQSYANGDYADALRGYLPLLETFDSSTISQYSLNFKVGFSYYASAPEDSFAVPFFRKYLESSNQHFEAYYFLGNISASNHEFDSAIYFFQKFIFLVEENTELSNSGLSEQIIDIAKRQIDKCQFGKFLVENPGCATIEGATGGVNTSYSEYAPVISPDETYMAFTRRSPETLGGRISDDGDFFEDIYFVKMNKTAVPLEMDSFGNAVGEATTEMILFSAPVNIGQKMNTVMHEGAVQFSADGNRFFLYRKSNIWVSQKKKKESEFITRNWKKAKRQKQIKGVFLPKTYEPSVSLSSDENTLYFSSERPGGFGGLDIYRSEKGTDGKWTAPVNLGETINTPSDEDAPFIANDGRTLYFSSKGHQNMGDYDIFVSELNGEHWSKPLNMGYPVNSSSDDIFYMVSSQSGTGFFSSNRANGSGLMDIYKAVFPSNTNSLAGLSGILLENDSIPAFASITLTDSEQPEDSISIFPDSVSGRFTSPLKFNKTYYISVNNPDFEPLKDTIIVPSVTYFCQQFSDTISLSLKRIIKDTAVVDSSLLAGSDSLNQDSTAINNADVKPSIEKESHPEEKLVFRVQLGAFKNPVSKDFFTRVPDLKEMSFEDGYTRYFAGSYQNINEARTRKDEIINDGFQGAFVVAFRDGVKIPLKDALSK